MAGSKSKMEKQPRLLYNKMITEIPRENLWPVLVGLLQHLLLHDDTTEQDYHYGMFAVTDTLRDAAYKQETNEGIVVDIELLTVLRRLHMVIS